MLTNLLCFSHIFIVYLYKEILLFWKGNFIMTTIKSGHVKIEEQRPVSHKKASREVKDKSDEIKDKVLKGSEEKEPFLANMEKLRSVREKTSHENVPPAMAFIRSFDKNLGIKEPFLQEKYDLMKTDPHVFYRAIPALFYHDLKNDFAGISKLLDRTAPEVTIDGDAHLRNFGTIKGPDKSVCWGLNDFDQAESGSPEWDLERMAVSAVLTGRLAGIDRDDISNTIEHIGKKYFHTIRKIASGNIDPHPAFLAKDEAEGKIEGLIKDREKISQKDFLKDYKKLNKNDVPVFIHSEELIPVSSAMKQKITKALSDYEKTIGETPRMKRPLQVYDIAEKLRSGGSSYGLPRYYTLVANADPNKEPLILEVKLLFESGIKDETGDLKLGDAKTVAEDQRAMQQNMGNPVTGYCTIDGYSYLVREYEREKKSTPLEDFTGAVDLNVLAKQAAEVLAFAHGRTKTDARKIDGWVKDDEDKAIANLKEFAFAYADKVQSDYNAFKKTF